MSCKAVSGTLGHFNKRRVREGKREGKGARQGYYWYLVVFFGDLFCFFLILVVRGSQSCVYICMIHKFSLVYIISWKKLWSEVPLLALKDANIIVRLLFVLLLWSICVVVVLVAVAAALPQDDYYCFWDPLFILEFGFLIIINRQRRIVQAGSEMWKWKRKGKEVWCGDFCGLKWHDLIN